MYCNYVYFKSRKHLSVPPGLGQRQQSLSLTFNVFFSAARSQVLSPFLFFVTDHQGQLYSDIVVNVFEL